MHTRTELCPSVPLYLYTPPFQTCTAIVHRETIYAEAGRRAGGVGGGIDIAGDGDGLGGGGGGGQGGPSRRGTVFLRKKHGGLCIQTGKGALGMGGAGTAGGALSGFPMNQVRESIIYIQ